MLRFLVFALFAFSFNAFSGITATFVKGGNYTDVHITLVLSCATVEDCINQVPPYIFLDGAETYIFRVKPDWVVRNVTATTFEILAYQGNQFRDLIFNYADSVDEPACSTDIECMAEASDKCIAIDEVLEVFNYISGSDYTYTCGIPETPEQECNSLMGQSCTIDSNLSFLNTYPLYNELTGSCDVYCSSEPAVCTVDSSLYCIPDPDSVPDPDPDCVETPENNYCDVASTPDTNLDFSDFDFSGDNGGATGSSTSGTSVDTPSLGNQYVDDLDYTATGKNADGTAFDPTTPFSALQGDVVINQLKRNSDDGAEFLSQMTQTTNATIVEKSDDISKNVLTAANGIIQAVNGISTPTFDDTGIVNGVKSGTDKIADDLGLIKDSLGSGYAPVSVAGNFDQYFTLFDLDSRTLINNEIANLKLLTTTENDSFSASLRNSFSFDSVGSTGYEARSLDLGKWGTHDISISRFTDYFGGLGSIVYMLAALTSFTIVMGGIKF